MCLESFEKGQKSQKQSESYRRRHNVQLNKYENKANMKYFFSHLLLNQ